MTAPVIAPNPASPFDAALRLVCLVYTLRIAELEQQLQDATDALTGCRQSVGDEQDAHQKTRLLLPPREERSNLRQVIADTAQSLAGIAERRGAR